MQRTIEAIERQIGAMGVEVFEVGAYRPGSRDASREPEMLLRTWDTRTLIASVSWLRFQNLNGRNIYIRPKGEHSLSLVDDLKLAALEAMKASGFGPAVVVETSPGNFQVWLNHGQVLPKELSTAVARALAERFGGDRGAADWRHFGRLSGFANRKEKYRQANGFYPFVKLIEATGHAYPEAPSFVAAVSKRLENMRREAELRRQYVRVHLANGAPHQKRIEDFRKSPAYAGDGNRIDLAYAIYALSHGVPELDVRAAIASRDLSHKGNEKRQMDYISRTVRKAYQRIDGNALGR